MNKWISVKDRLPEVYRNEYDELIPFLVCVNGTEYPFRAMYDGKNWGNGWSKIAVTHWMPLPEPPKPERKHEPMNCKLLDKVNELDLKIESQLSKLKDVMLSMGDALQAVDEMKHLSPENAKNIKHLIKETYEDMIEEIQLEVDQDTDFLNELKESLPRCYWGAQCEKE